MKAGLPEKSVPALLKNLAGGSVEAGSVEGATEAVWEAARSQRARTYAHAYRLAWASVAPFVVLAIVAVSMLRGVKEQMTERVEAPVERVGREVERGDEKGVDTGNSDKEEGKEYAEAVERA